MPCELPDYANITPEALARACRGALEDCDARIAALIAIPAGQRTFENTVAAAEEARAAVKEAHTAYGGLAEVSPDRELRDAAREWDERLEKRAVAIGLDERVYRAVREFADGAGDADGADGALPGEDARRGCPAARGPAA